MIHPITELKAKDLRGKIVFLRGSADVPLDDDLEYDDPLRIKDTTRIESFLPTLIYLIKKDAKVVLQPGWIGRPDGVEKKKSVIPVYHYIKKRLTKEKALKGIPLIAPTDVNGNVKNIADNFDIIQQKISTLSDGQVLILENPRFDSQYNKGDEGYAKQLAGMVDLYVADDFAQRHRPAADIINMTKYLPHYVGLHLKSEIDYAQKISSELGKEERGPFVFILAGKKIETKPGVVSKITVALKLLDRMRKRDKILVAGAVAYTFMIANDHLERVKMGIDDIKKITKNDIKNLIGDSYVQWDQVYDQIMLAGRVILKAEEKGITLILPQDHTIVKNGIIKKGDVLLDQEHIPSGWMGVDIGTKTINLFTEAIMTSGFVVMSGPVGMFDKKSSVASKGSVEIAKALDEATKKGIITVSAGGESTLLINQTGVTISHASIGGGSTLEFIEKGTLPGIDVLKD